MTAHAVIASCCGVCYRLEDDKLSAGYNQALYISNERRRCRVEDW
jgi:hypothetical protein